MFGYDEEILMRSGSFGKLYRVKKGDEFFALKEMSDASMRDREAKFLKLADHPLFPEYVDSFDEGNFFILEEYIWGNPFDECIERRGGYAQPECMRFALSVADGIAFLQQADKSIIFRDLKAENLILQPDGEIRLCDLGSACFLEEADGSGAGTRGASAPEQLEGGHQGMYSDVYSFGKLMYHMLTGKRAAGGDVSIRKIDPGFSASLELLIRQCCRDDPEERIPDMYGVLQRLVDIATCNPREYVKLEKNAMMVLKDMDEGKKVSFKRNVQL
ncbi:MAG: protein kinase [Lachnospiraceae bacterium]|nr:protein kinase [Lachnospiraceae bacterium]